MATTSATATPSPAPSAAPSRAPSKSKPKMIVKLRVSPSNLAQFPPDTTTAVSKPKAAPMPPTSPYETVKVAPKDQAAADEANSASAAAQSNEETPSGGASQVNGVKRKAPGGASGTGESATKKQKVDDATNPKGRGKPGPKRRKGVDGDTGAPTTSHKINPKANTGAINANLRALDLTKKAPRKWQKKGLHFTSFTGKSWDIPRWNSHMRSMNDTAYDGDYTSATTPSSQQAKNEPVSSVPSNSGEGPNGMATSAVQPSTDFASSPAPQPMEGIAAA